MLRVFSPRKALSIASTSHHRIVVGGCSCRKKCIRDRGGYKKLNLGGPGSFCRSGCRIGGSRAQTARKIFSHRSHYTCRFHVLCARIFSRHYSAIWTEFIFFSHAIGFCFDRAIGSYAFPANALVSLGPHPSALSPCRPGESLLTHSRLSLLDETTSKLRPPRPTAEDAWALKPTCHGSKFTKCAIIV